MKIAVLMGGTSGEREVSLKTGKAVLEACRQNNFDAIPIILDSNLPDLVQDLLDVDLVFIALHGGIGENGTIQGFFDSLGIKYTGSGPISSALCLDKHLSKILVKASNIRTPDWLLIKNRRELPDSFPFSFPLIVKPNDQGSTIGLSIVKDSKYLIPAVEKAFSCGSEVMIEKYISGDELTVTIIAGEVYPIVKIIPSHELYDYDCKYKEGLSQYECPANLPDSIVREVQKLSRKIYNILKCRHYGRVDFLLDSQGVPWFLELNTLPGMTGTSLTPKAAAAKGLLFNDLIKKLILEVYHT